MYDGRMSSANTTSTRIEPTLYSPPPVRRQRLAVERALRSDRPVAERAADIALELIPDVDYVRDTARVRAAAVLAMLLERNDVQTALELATVVQAYVMTGAADATDLYPMHGRLLIAAFSTRREQQVAPAERRRASRPFAYESVAA